MPQPSVRTGFRNDRDLRRWSRFNSTWWAMLPSTPGALVPLHSILSLRGAERRGNPFPRPLAPVPAGIRCAAAPLRADCHNPVLRTGFRNDRNLRRWSRFNSTWWVTLPSAPGALIPMHSILSLRGAERRGNPFSRPPSPSRQEYAARLRRSARIATTQCCAPGFAMTETYGVGPVSTALGGQRYLPRPLLWYQCIVYCHCHEKGYL